MLPLDQILKTIGARLHTARAERGWSVRELAERSGVSKRFVFQVEKGQANVSVGKLYQLLSALELEVEALFQAPQAPARVALDGLLDGLSAVEQQHLLTKLRDEHNDARANVVALLGMRGAGKSTVGARLAEALRVPFVELDGLVEAQASLSLGEIFSLHGPEFYEQLERECLRTLLAAGARVVVATGGGVVTHDEAYSLLTTTTTCVWLRATPEAHWRRVVEQGDRRPMSGRPEAFDQLCSILDARTARYEEAHVVVDTTHTSPEAVTAEILTRLKALGVMGA